MIHQKNLYIYLIIGFVLLIPFKNNSQDLNYKYELEPSTLRQADELYETNYLSAKNSDLLLLQNSTTTKIAELKFTDETLDRVYDAINTNPNYIFHQFHIGDLNNDGIDDLIISETGDYKLILYYYSSKRKILSRTKLLEIEIGREQLIGNIYYLPVDCDGDNKLEVFMSLAVNYPGPRAYRGIFLLDPEDSDIKWFYPTADNIYNLLSFQNKDGNKFLVYSSSGVTNGIIYKDNSFYDEVERNNYKKIYDLKKSDINKMTRVIDADYSTDSVSVVKAIDINGSLMWAKEVGKNYSWSSIISTNSPKKELLVSVRHKRTTDNTKDFIRKVDPLSGNTLKQINLPIFIHPTPIFLHNKFHYISADGDKIISVTPELDISYKTLDAKLQHFDQSVLTFDNDTILAAYSQEHILYLVNSDFSIAGKEENIENFNILPSHNMISVLKKGHITLNNLTYVPLWERIDTQSYAYLLSGILTILFLISVLWLITMNISKNKIEKQKLQIEENKLHLEEATQKLIQSDKLAVLGTISSSLAHEINSPLGAILNASERISSEELSPDGLKNRKLIEQSAKRIKKIVEKLLSHASIKNDISKIDVKNEIENWLSLFGREFEVLGISIDNKLEPGIILKISEDDFQHLVSNTLNNSKDALVESKVKVIEIYSVDNLESIEIIITDSGPGFDAQILEKPFQPFKTTKKNGEGTGLGLWLVNRIMKKYDGNVYLSNTNKGAETKLVFFKSRAIG